MIIEPRNCDAEDDLSSTKTRSLLAIAGSLLGEISLPEPGLAWVIGALLPSLLLGAGRPGSPRLRPDGGAGAFPQARWILALHHHPIEYPKPAKAISERIGTTLINGSRLLRLLRPIAARTVAMHGHRHIDWIGRCGALKIVSAPSPVMEASDAEPTYFYIHTLAAAAGGIGLLEPQRIVIEPAPVTT